MKAAFFDFDDTLTHGDTLPFFLASVRGWPWTILAYALAAAAGPFIPCPGSNDRRGRIKAVLLRLTLAGLPATRAQRAGGRMKPRIRWRTAIVAELRRHHEQGHRIVVVSGAATIYLPALLADLPVDEILGTELEAQDGVLTGRIAGVNRVRAAKAATVRDWLAIHRPEQSWGYGNAPHDLDMLALLDHKTVV